MKRCWLVVLALGMGIVGVGCDEEPLSSALGDLTVEPEILDFGPMWVGESAQGEVEIRNDGRVAARLLLRGLVPPFHGPTEVTVPAAGATTVAFDFRPVDTGAVAATVSFESSDHPVFTVELRGEGAIPQLGVDSSLDFGSVAVGETVERTLAIRNEAPLPVPELRFEVTGPEEAWFSVERAPRLGANATVEFALSFAPTAVTSYRAALVLSPCRECGEVVVALSGTGIDRALFADPETLDFRNVLPGATRTRALRIGNAGALSATLAELRVEGDGFSADASALPVELSQDDETTVDVTFAPAEAGDREGRLVFVDDAGKEALVVPLRGYGGGPNLVAEPAAIDLGEVPFGWRGSVPVSLRNVGEAFPVDLVAATIEGAPAWWVATPPLPVAIDATGVVVDVGFVAPDVDRSEAVLVLASSDPDWSEVRVPLAARVTRGGDCRIDVFPSPFRFGVVDRRYVPVVRELELTNVGPEPCLLHGIALDPTGSDEFYLPEPPEARELGPGETLLVEVGYAPGPSLEVARTSLVYRTNNPAAPGGVVEVSGWAPDFNLRAIPPVVDFDYVPLEWTRQEYFFLSQGSPLRRYWVVDTRLAPGSHESFLPVPIPENPWRDYTHTLTAGFAPTVPGHHRGIVEVWLEERPYDDDPVPLPEPVVVGLRGQSGPCGDQCEPPVPICPAPTSGPVGETVTLVGSGLDPTGDPITCQWQVLSSPPGSNDLLFAPDRCETLFQPDMAGQYTIRLEVRDPMGHAAECRTTFEATPPTTGLWVEMYWDVPNDIDLHLLHPAAGDPWGPESWYDEVYDCNWTNRTPEWDAPGPADDPAYVWDDVSGTGPENIHITAPAAHAYHVGAIFFQQRTFGVQVHPTANVYCYGVLVGTRQVTLSSLHDVAFVGTVTFAEDGSCTWAEAVSPPDP